MAVYGPSKVPTSLRRTTSEPAREQYGVGTSRTTARRTQPVDVLIIGDNERDISVARLRLRRFRGRSFAVDVAQSKQAAVERAKERHPDILLFLGWPRDYPDAGIFDVLPSLLASLPFSGAIVVTSGDPGEERDARRAGAHAVLERRSLGNSWMLPSLVLKLAEAQAEADVI